MSKLCECGCGKEVTNEKNKFINGHNNRGISSWNKGLPCSTESKEKIRLANTGKRHTEETKERLRIVKTGRIVSAETRLKLSEYHKTVVGWKHTPDTKKQMSDNNAKYFLGKKLSDEHKQKLSKALKGKKKSDNTKLLMSISTIKYIEDHKLNGKPMYPRVGKNETLILDEIQKETGLEINRNDHDIACKIGKFPDGYIPKYNLVIDVLEPEHFADNNELIEYDKNREVLIAARLSCMLYYIPEQEFLKNPEKEKQRFKDFLNCIGEQECSELH